MDADTSEVSSIQSASSHPPNPNSQLVHQQQSQAPNHSFGDSYRDAIIGPGHNKDDSSIENTTSSSTATPDVTTASAPHPPQLPNASKHSSDMDLVNSSNTDQHQQQQEEEDELIDDSVMVASSSPQQAPARSRSLSGPSASEPALTHARPSADANDKSESLGDSFMFGPVGFGGKKRATVEEEEDGSIEPTQLHVETVTQDELDPTQIHDEELGDGSVAMDFTRIAGQSQRGDEDDEDEEGDEDVSAAMDLTTGGADESRRSPSTSPTKSIFNQSPASSPNKPNLLDDFGAPPSSSNIVEDNLRPKLGAKKAFLSLPASNMPNPSPSNDTEPSSSAETDNFRPSLVLDGGYSPQKGGKGKGRREGSRLGGSHLSAGDDDSPIPTSTPAIFGAPPPQPPLTVKKSVDHIKFAPRPSAPVSPKKPAAPGPAAIYQASTALENVPPKVKPKRDIWRDDEESSDEEEVVPEATQEDTEDEDEEGDEEPDVTTIPGSDEVSTPRASATQPVATMEIDSQASGVLSPPPPAHQPTPKSYDGRSSRESSPGQVQEKKPLRFSLGDLDSQSQSQSLDHDGPSHPRISDIAELPSSLEMSQIEIEPTQVDHDVLMPDEPSRSIPNFLHDTGDNSKSVSVGQYTVPENRRLRRSKPPPTSSIDVGDVEPTQMHVEPTQLAAPESSPPVPLRTTVFRPNASSSSSASNHGKKLPSSGSSLSSTNSLGLAAPVSSFYAVPSASLSVPPASIGPKSTISSNGVVPDSQNPSSGGQKKQVPQQEPPAEPEDPMDVDDTAFEDVEGEEVVEEAAKDAGMSTRGKGRRRLSHVEVVVPKAKSKAKGKAAPTGKAAPKGKAKKPAAAAATTKPRLDKGKGRAISPPFNESPDELDLLCRESNIAGPAPVAEAEPEDDFFQETNYDELPTPNNVRRRSGGRRQPSPSPPLPPRPAPKNNKRKQEPGPVEPKKRAKKEKAPPATKKGGNQALDVDQSIERSPSPVRSPPAAGPSRLRFNTTDAVVQPNGDISNEPSADEDEKPLGPKKSKLPSTAPFRRVFALWRDDGFFYPGTIISVSKGFYSICFDDRSEGNLKASELRRCELQRGDRVRFRGDENFDSETQAESLAADVRIYRVERPGGEDADGELGFFDVAVVTEEHVAIEDQADAAARKERLDVSALCITPEHGGQFDDRKLTEEEIEQFETRARKPAKPLALLPVTEPSAPSPFKANKKTLGIFARMAFIITSAPNPAPTTTTPRKRAASKGATPDPDLDKKNLAKLIKDEGGAVIDDVGQLFTLESHTGNLHLDFHTSTFRGIEHVLLLTDRPCSTPKFLVALALSIPCVSREFVTVSLKKAARQDWRMFAVPAGFVPDWETSVVGGQVAALRRTSFGLSHIEARWEEGAGIFDGKSILMVVPPKKGKTSDELHSFRTIFTAGGATQVDFVASSQAASTAADYDYVVLDESHAMTNELSKHSGVRRADWMKMSLITGKMLD